MDVPIFTPDGYFVSEHHRRVAEIIAEYDSNLRLAFIPYSQRDPNDPLEKPFAIVDLNTNYAKPHFVLYADEDEIKSGKILARLFSNDLAHNDIGGKLAAEEDAYKLLELKEKIERTDHIIDVLKTSKRRSFS